MQTRFRKFIAVAVAPWLVACAELAPGMRVESQPVQGAPAAVPDIKVITADLVQREKTFREQQAGPDLSALIGAPQPYRIGPGDILAITVWDHPELNLPAVPVGAATPAGVFTQIQPGQGYVVDYNGMVQFPAAGVIKLAGLTEVEARNLLADRLVKAIQKPDLTIRVQNYRSQRIYVDGEVKTPGSQPIDDVPMTLLEGIGRAGGFLPTADQSRITINRKGVNYRVSVPQLRAKGIDPSKLMLANGDVVRVHPAAENKVYVLGEVTTPRALLMNNGYMTLSEALGEAGGLNPLSSEGRQVYVVRNAGAVKPEVYNLDARSPIALALAENFELQPRDVVYVDATGLARFNRVISLILPGTTGAAAITGAVK